MNSVVPIELLFFHLRSGINRGRLFLGVFHLSKFVHGQPNPVHCNGELLVSSDSIIHAILFDKALLGQQVW